MSIVMYLLLICVIIHTAYAVFAMTRANNLRHSARIEGFWIGAFSAWVLFALLYGSFVGATPKVLYAGSALLWVQILSYSIAAIVFGQKD